MDMTKKEIMKVFRFTNRVHDSFKKTTTSLDLIYDNFRDLERQLKTVSRKVDRLGLSKTPESDWCAISSRARDLTRKIAFLEHPRNVFRCYQPISFSRLSLDVLSLVRKGARVKMAEGTTKLIVYVPDITLKDTNDEAHFFENLRVEFLPDESGLTVFVTGPEFKDTGYCHPHVNNDGAICEGVAKRLIQNGLKTCDVVGVFDLVEALLKTYNPDSPFFELGGSDELHCDQCGDQVSDMSCCANCGEYVCGDCSSGCYCGRMTLYDGYLCPSCINKCAECATHVCDNCEIHCTGCKESHCPDCVSLCADCGCSVCDDCHEHCAVCDANVCPNCKKANHDGCENKEDEVEETG